MCVFLYESCVAGLARIRQHRGMQIQPSSRPRLNDEILAQSVRVIGAEGKQMGVMPTSDARRLAASCSLDLIEVASASTPPVCRIGDYGRLKYAQSKKSKEARRTHVAADLREVQLTPRTENHDYLTKLRKAEDLLGRGAKVKVSVIFRGREVIYAAFGRRILDRMVLDLTSIAAPERAPVLEGKRMTMILCAR